MKIGIIGGGSIGLLFAFYLNQSFSVTIYTRTSEQAARINKEGLKLFQNGYQKQLFVPAASIDSWEGKEDIHLVAVKQYHLKNLIKEIVKKDCQNTGRFLFLQNGMGHLKLLKKFPAREIFIGSVEHGAFREGANIVHHNGMGVTRIAAFKGNTNFLENFQAKTPVSFPFVLESDYYHMLVKKLIVNAAINPLTAILQVRNGELIENPHYNDILQGVFSELMSILKLENKDDDLYNHIEAVCKNTSQNRSSMLKDLESNRPTEADAILGYLLEEAENSLIDAPLIRTFYHLVKGKEFKKGDELND